MDPRLEEVGPVLPSGLRQRKFTDAAISKAMDAALDRIAPGKHGVIFRGSVDDETIGFVLAAKIDDRWSVGLVLDIEKATGERTFGFEVGLEF